MTGPSHERRCEACGESANDLIEHEEDESTRAYAALGVALSLMTPEQRERWDAALVKLSDRRMSDDHQPKFRVTAAQVEALHHLLALMRQPADVASPDRAAEDARRRLRETRRQRLAELGLTRPQLASREEYDL
jgi:hypothetical protein